MIETQNLILRRPEARDIDAIVTFFMSPRAVTLGGPFALGPAWRIGATVLGHWAIRGFGLFAVTRKTDDRTIGLIGPWYPIDWPETELGWTILADDLEGQGVAFEAAQASRDFAFDVLKWSTAVSYIKSANARSIALAERLGAKVDPTAALPASFTEIPHVVYRHPRTRP